MKLSSFKLSPLSYQIWSIKARKETWKTDKIYPRLYTTFVFISCCFFCWFCPCLSAGFSLSVGRRIGSVDPRRPASRGSSLRQSCALVRFFLSLDIPAKQGKSPVLCLARSLAKRISALTCFRCSRSRPLFQSPCPIAVPLRAGLLFNLNWLEKVEMF